MFFDIFCQTCFVLVFDIHKFLLGFFVICIDFQLAHLGPGHQGGNDGINVKAPVVLHQIPFLAQEPVADVPADGIYEEQPVDGKYSTMGALYQAWGGYEGYPDYVCGAWSTDGGMDNLTVAVTDDKAGEQGREEILSQLQDHSSVTFTTQTYSYRQLQQVMDEIVTEFETNPPKWLVLYYNRPFSPPYDERVAAIFENDYAFVDAKGQYQLLRLKEDGDA